jgi:hypothetical protein
MTVRVRIAALVAAIIATSLLFGGFVTASGTVNAFDWTDEDCSHRLRCYPPPPERRAGRRVSILGGTLG